MFKKVISLALSVVFSLQTCGFAQVGQINLAGYLGQGGGAPVLDRFRPAHLRYFSYEPKSDNFQILLDKADEKGLSDIQVKDKADELMKYFRIGLSLPNDKFWVNLRPDAPEQIIDPELERTDIGKIMLEADLQLKKDTASLTSPQTKEGKEYWDKLYQKAGELFGTENITIPTITRPWIVPGEIIVRESGDSAYIYKAALKVMLEQDHLKGSLTYDFSREAGSRNRINDMAGKDPRMKELNEYSSQLIRDLIIPKLTKEVNRAKRYAGLRQVFYSLVLSRWFKDKFNQPQSGNELTKLIDSGNLSKLSSKEAWDKTAYFKAYQKSFKEGEYNLSEPVYTPTGQVIRRYMSGGTLFGNQIRIEQYSNMVDSLIAPKGAYVITGNGLTDQTAISASSALESLKDKAMGRLSQYLNEKEFYQAFLNMKEADTIVSLKEVFDNIVKSLKDKVEDVRTLADFSNTLSVLITIEEAKVILGKKEQYIKNAYETYASLNKENQLKNLADIVHELTDTALETKRLASEIEKKWAKTAGSPLKELKDKIIRMLVKNSRGQMMIGGQDISKKIHKAETTESLKVVFDEIIESIDKANKPGSEWTQIRINELKEFSARLLILHKLEMIGGDLKAQLNVLSAVIKKLPSLKENEIKPTLDALFKLNKAFTNNIENREKDIAVSLNKFGSPLTMEQAKKSGIQRIAMIKDLDEEITRKYVSWIEDAKNFADIYNALDAFMVQNQKEDELELILEKKRLKPGIFSDALNEFEVTVNRIEQPKFKHYKDSYPRFVVYLGGRELPLILRIHNADIKNEAYVYGLNVYETLKNGLGGDLYFSSEVSSKGGVIVTSMSEKMLEVKPKDLNILAEKIGEILGDSIVSSAVVAGEHVGGIDFRQMNMLIQPMGSFSGLDFSPARLSGSALEAMDLDKGLENIKQMASSSMLPSPQRLKEYISACIFKGKIDEKADDFILSMLEVFQLQAEEGIESAALEREAVVMADTRSYVLPEKRLAVSNSHSLN